MPGWFRTAAAIAACFAAGCMGQAGQTDPDDYAPPTFMTTAAHDVVSQARTRLDDYWPFPEELPMACAFFAAHEWAYADAWAAANREAPRTTDVLPPTRTIALINAIGRAVHDAVVPYGEVFAIVAENEQTTDKYPRYPRIWTRADWADYEAALETRQRAVTQALCGA